MRAKRARIFSAGLTKFDSFQLFVRLVVHHGRQLRGGHDPVTPPLNPRLAGVTCYLIIIESLDSNAVNQFNDKW